MNREEAVVRCYGDIVQSCLEAKKLAQKAMANRKAELASIDANESSNKEDLRNEVYDRYAKIMNKYQTVIATAREIMEYRTRGFYLNLCRRVYGSPDIKCQGIMNSALIAEHMHITPTEVDVYMEAAVCFGITERQGGMWVV